MELDEFTNPFADLLAGLQLQPEEDSMAEQPAESTYEELIKLAALSRGFLAG